MSLTQIYAAVAGHVITAARWNNEFGNIYANGTDLAFPLTKAVSLAGWTLTLDAAGATTLLSTASQGFIFSAGNKSGAPSANGVFVNVASATFTDTSTSASGTADLWAGTSFRIPMLSASNSNVTTTDAATVYIEGPPSAGTNETLTESSALLVDGKVKIRGELRCRYEDSRTDSVIRPFTFQATTNAAPAAGIGVGLAFRGDSADTEQQLFGNLDFVFTDVGANSEDSRFDIWTSVGGGVAKTYSFEATAQNNVKLTHGNTADRVVTLADHNFTLQSLATGPRSTGTGSAAARASGLTTLTTATYSGIHFYESVIIDVGQTMTIGTGQHCIVIVASDTITINGTISTVGGGFAGGTGSTGAATPGGDGSNGMCQPAGGGGQSQGPDSPGGSGGSVYKHGLLVIAGGSGNPAAAGTQLTTTAVQIVDPFSYMGSPGGGGGGGRVAKQGGNGGRGAGQLILIAPNIVFGAAAVLNTSGSNGSVNQTDCGGGGGGAAGNIYIYCNTLTDGGVTKTQSGGSGGVPGGGGQTGGAGANGITQQFIYG